MLPCHRINQLTYWHIYCVDRHLSSMYNIIICDELRISELVYIGYYSFAHFTQAVEETNPGFFS